MFGLCIYPVLYLIYQTNQKNYYYENIYYLHHKFCRIRK